MGSFNFLRDSCNFSTSSFMSFDVNPEALTTVKRCLESFPSCACCVLCSSLYFTPFLLNSFLEDISGESLSSLKQPYVAVHLVYRSLLFHPSRGKSHKYLVFHLSQQKTIYGRHKLFLPCRMSGKTKYKTRTDEDVAFLINTAFVSKAYTYNHGDSMRHWDTITEKLNRTMRLTEAAAIPSWKVKCKFKDSYEI